MPGKITVNKNELKFFDTMEKLISAGEGFCYLKDEQTLVIKAADKKNLNISIK